MTKRNQKRWREYEREKQALKRKQLPPEEYERRIKELAKRLGI